MTHNAASLLSNQVGMRTWISGQCLHFVICWVCFLKVLKVNVTCFTCFITCFKVVDGFGSLHDFCFHTAIRWLWTCLQILQELDLAIRTLRTLHVKVLVVLGTPWLKSGKAAIVHLRISPWCCWAAFPTLEEAAVPSVPYWPFAPESCNIFAFKTFPMLSISFDQRKIHFCPPWRWEQLEPDAEKVLLSTVSKGTILGGGDAFGYVWAILICSPEWNKWYDPY